MTFTIESTSTNCLESNLRALAERNGDLVERLRTSAARFDFQSIDTPQGVPAGVLGGRALCSRRRPLDEASRLTDDIDLVENAVAVVVGFGMGYHVRSLAERMGRKGVIVVFEPDLALIRAVLESVDHSDWLRNSLVVWITDPTDTAALATHLRGCESILAQGIAFLHHPASRERLDGSAQAFQSMFTEHVASAKTTLMTTLVRSVDTVRNQLGNIDHYVNGPGITDLEGVASGKPAVLVSAGPSLQRNIRQLTAPGVRDRCIIIAVQTALKPLLEAGVKPHFVTALDYHAISARFYESLTPEDVDGVTLVAEPKAHPVILDAFPGVVRCCAAPFLDLLLQDATFDHGTLPAGATVAHLSMYLATHMGCDPIILTGQDLGFTDGLYYAPGTAIEDDWAGELNPFNTIEMMQWQRIARHRSHLRKAPALSGGEVYTDQQMATYLNQFERDFAGLTAEGVKIIDATEGGVAKQHTQAMTLTAALEAHAKSTLEPLPIVQQAESTARNSAIERLRTMRSRIAALSDTSSRTVKVLRKMIANQTDKAVMDACFTKIDRFRGKVDQAQDAFQVVNFLNQLGAFKRFKADRRLDMQPDLEPLEYQKLQLERDIENVRWIIDASDELINWLSAAERIVNGDATAMPKAKRRSLEDDVTATPHKRRVAALIPYDPTRCASASLFERTIERIATCKSLDEIIILVPSGATMPQPVTHSLVSVHECDGDLFGPEFEAIDAGRRWAGSSWRGGISGLTAFDEVICPAAMSAVMKEQSIDAALVVGPDWSLVDVSPATGCEALIQRHLENPDQHPLTFTQAPPGLGGCVISAAMMAELATRTRSASIGAMLVHQPANPQGDAITHDANITIDPRVRNALIRAIPDSPDRAGALAGLETTNPVDSAEALERAIAQSAPPLPTEVIIELNIERASSGEFVRNCRFSDITRRAMTLDLARRIIDQLAPHNIAVTFAGVGDPAMHDDLRGIIEHAQQVGLPGVHIRTELPDGTDCSSLLLPGVDVISVDLHADTAVTYQTMMGHDAFGNAIDRIGDLLRSRRRLTHVDSTKGFALPWIVPRMQRCQHTLSEIDTFYDRWQYTIGAVAIDAIPPFDRCDDPILRAPKPRRVVESQLRSRLTILSDGSVPISELDWRGESTVGSIADQSIECLWALLCESRQEIARAHPRRGELEPVEALRTFFA